MRHILAACICVILGGCSDIEEFFQPDRYGFRMLPESYGAFHFAVVTLVGCGPATNKLHKGDAIIEFDGFPVDKETGMTQSVYDMLSRKVAEAPGKLELIVRKGGFNGPQVKVTLMPGVSDMSRDCPPKSSGISKGRPRAAFFFET